MDRSRRSGTVTGSWCDTVNRTDPTRSPAEPNVSGSSDVFAVTSVGPQTSSDAARLAVASTSSCQGAWYVPKVCPAFVSVMVWRSSATECSSFRTSASSESWSTPPSIAPITVTVRPPRW